MTGVHVSAAVAPAGVTCALEFPVHSAVTAGGHVIVGAVVSTTVTLVRQEATLFEPSFALKVRFVVPKGNELTPLGPVTVTTEQLSVAVAGATFTDALKF